MLWCVDRGANSAPAAWVRCTDSARFFLLWLLATAGRRWGDVGPVGGPAHTSRPGGGRGRRRGVRRSDVDDVAVAPVSPAHPTAGGGSGASICHRSGSGGSTGFGLGEQSGFAGGEDSLGSAGRRQTTSECNGGGGFRTLEGNGEQVDQGIYGERVVVAVLIEKSAPAGATEVLGLQGCLDGVAKRRCERCPSARRRLLRGARCSRSCGRRACRPWGTIRAGLPRRREGVGDDDGHRGGNGLGRGRQAVRRLIRPRPGVMSMRIRATLVAALPRSTLNHGSDGNGDTDKDLTTMPAAGRRHVGRVW